MEEIYKRRKNMKWMTCITWNRWRRDIFSSACLRVSGVVDKGKGFGGGIGTCISSHSMECLSGRDLDMPSGNSDMLAFE
jgi:hypothetical protein